MAVPQLPKRGGFRGLAFRALELRVKGLEGVGFRALGF